MPKGRMTIRNEPTSDLPTGNPLAAPRASRPNKRIHLWEIESANPTIVALERAYERSLAEVDALGSRYTEAIKSGKFTEQGLRDEITQAALQSTAAFKAARNTIDKARDEMAELRKQTALPKPDFNRRGCLPAPARNPQSPCLARRQDQA